jgi:hypothetical protein
MSDRASVHEARSRRRRLLNVRLGEDDARLARGLRENGVSISELVREALRAEARRRQALQAFDVDALLAEMIEAHPTPAQARSPRRTALDRRAVKATIRAKLRGRR